MASDGSGNVAVAQAAGDIVRDKIELKAMSVKTSRSLDSSEVEGGQHGADCGRSSDAY
jgi:hypothetical protein